MQEMPLLVFTIFEQTAIGMFAALAVAALAGKLGSNRKLGFVLGMAVFVLAVLGACASLFHLGQPLRAANILRGLGSSWLSREIVFFGLFALCALAYALIERSTKEGSPSGIAKAVAVLGVVFGLLALVSTSLCYMQPGVPAWDSALTPAQFALTTVVCGVPLFFAMRDTLEKHPTATRWWVVFGVLLASQVVMRYFFFANIVLLVNLV